MKKIAAFLDAQESIIRNVFRLVVLALLCATLWQAKEASDWADAAHDKAYEAKDEAANASSYANRASVNSKEAAESCRELRYRR